MSETPEAAVKREIRTRLAGHLQRAPVTGGYGRSGQLDFVCCIHGHYVAIEAKSVRSSYGVRGPTALQWEEIDAILAAGGIAMSIDETQYGALQQAITALEFGLVAQAAQHAAATLARHTRPTLTVNDEPQPRKKERK